MTVPGELARVTGLSRSIAAETALGGDGYARCSRGERMRSGRRKINAALVTATLGITPALPLSSTGSSAATRLEADRRVHRDRSAVAPSAWICRKSPPGWRRSMNTMALPFTTTTMRHPVALLFLVSIRCLHASSSRLRGAGRAAASFISMKAAADLMRCTQPRTFGRCWPPSQGVNPMLFYSLERLLGARAGRRR